jgi:hypothetical protein
VRTGENAFHHTHGAGLFDYLAGHPEIASVFGAAMTGYSADQTPTIAATYDFSRMSLVVDVGGGHGRLMARDSPSWRAGAPRHSTAVREAERLFNRIHG